MGLNWNIAFHWKLSRAIAKTQLTNQKASLPLSKSLTSGFSWILSVANVKVKLHIMVLLIELYPFMPHLMTLTFIQGHIGLTGMKRLKVKVVFLGDSWPSKFKLFQSGSCFDCLLHVGVVLCLLNF